MRKFIVLMIAISMITLAFGQEREPNNQKTQADPITALNFHGVMASSSDIDWFVLNGQEGSNPTFTITHAPSVDFDVEIYSDNNTVGRAVGSNSGDSVTCQVPGKCFVKVWSSRGSGPYQIAIRAKSDEREPNDQKSQADRIAKTQYEINGTIANAGDVDWFALDGQEGNHPTFVITHAPSVDFDLEVYSDNNSVGRATGSNSPDRVTCDVPGKCFLKVWSCRGTGEYQIEIQPQQAANTDEREPNNEKGQADEIANNKMTIHGTIDRPGDVDWFALKGQEGNNPTFTIIHDNSVDFDIEIYSDENQVGRATGVNSGDSVTCNVPGNCFVKVWSSRGTGRYEVRINR